MLISVQFMVCGIFGMMLFTMPGLNWCSAICSVVAASKEVWREKTFTDNMWFIKVKVSF